MKIDFITEQAGVSGVGSRRYAVRGETDRLTDVLLCGPSHLEPVPCCSVTREMVRKGFSISRTAAQRQHAALRAALEEQGVRCHILPAKEDLPDLCFTRDAGVMTPWGFVALNPAMPHRLKEVDHLADAITQLGAGPIRRIEAGTIEGGDICIARRGLLIIGMSGERTTPEGAEVFAAPFRQQGWEVLTYGFDPHFLHLDTIFCMLDAQTALACVDVLDDGFMDAVTSRGIRLLPASYKESRRLGCNILSIDGRTILMSAGHGDAAQRVEAAGFDVVQVDVSQFSACGGGIHCLTMPLRRESGDA